MKTITNLMLLAMLLTTSAFAAKEDNHDETKHEETEQGEEDHGNEIELSTEQRSAAGIVVEPLTLRSLTGEISAPGEVKLNAYRTRMVAPRITAQVMRRHVRLGEKVTQGQALVTLSSVDMAEAQGAFQVAEREWQRVRKLGRSTVSDRRYTEAQVAREQARAKANAYGMTADQVDALLSNEKGPADGTFQLLAPQAGTIIRDDFIEGEFIEPGRVLFEISDESQVWIEASLTPEEALGVKVDTKARVHVDDHWLEGRVIQSHHILNETTRTLAVRIEVPNPDERLHPGLFVETRIQGDAAVEALAVPEDAVLRSPDGDWVVFVEDEPDRFKSVEIEVERIINDLAVITGVEAGIRVVVKGAFFVQSELAKSGFEVHNH